MQGALGTMAGASGHAGADMSNIINFPVVKKAISKSQALKQIDVEYIQQAILDIEALQVHVIDAPGDEIPDDLQDAMISAMTDYEMAVLGLLEWAKNKDPLAFKGNFTNVRKGAANE